MQRPNTSFYSMFPFSFWDELLRYSRLDNAAGFGACLAGGPAEPRCSSSKQNRPARMTFWTPWVNHIYICKWKSSRDNQYYFWMRLFLISPMLWFLLNSFGFRKKSTWFGFKWDGLLEVFHHSSVRNLWQIKTPCWVLQMSGCGLPGPVLKGCNEEQICPTISTCCLDTGPNYFASYSHKLV